ncbi:hypothetical protein PAL_GLEAN10023924 [Pteropus alecto]|uniref:Uncharacterized protein n=1 Tax=Pteropus alecto TaxID=9402 RepID=L5K760_PTEAL|nr:hypothetical protein PAL_GLEAN10023924 [Pteropus alecto]
MLEVTLGFSWSPTTSSSLPHKSIDVEVFELPTLDVIASAAAGIFQIPGRLEEIQSFYNLESHMG